MLAAGSLPVSAKLPVAVVGPRRGKWSRNVKFFSEAEVSIGLGAVAIASRGRRQRGRRSSCKAGQDTAPRMDVSPWHNLDLYVTPWAGSASERLRYVNEMPLGTLLKFEVQPGKAQNAIREDVKGSERLAAFGQPVPFNYGCFPQTYRDPEQLDETYGAPGDDDPLDVLDLSMEPVLVGEVVECHPLGAVCLIDEGQADWKVLVVNVASKGALAEARSVEDVERIAPGRIEECLNWMDSFKRSSGKDDATLHFDLHSEAEARELIAADHKSWQELVADANTKGRVRGHWIRQGPGLWEALKKVPQLQQLKEQLPAEIKEQLKPVKDVMRSNLKMASARGRWIRTPLFRFRWWLPISPVDPWEQLKQGVTPLKAAIPRPIRKQLSPFKEELKRQIKTASGRG
mmetsp:Transcript_22612/g.40829  ORF Transcript_22612/g.40829 Transcript_22612/m.40829 type:complete len:401 (+) Transcript_22612:53-1255(+)